MGKTRLWILLTVFLGLCATVCVTFLTNRQDATLAGRLAQLRPGMTEAQVKQAVGSPVSMANLREYRIWYFSNNGLEPVVPSCVFSGDGKLVYVAINDHQAIGTPVK